MSTQLAGRILVAVTALAGGPASATNWIVDPAGPLASIQQAIDGARGGDLVIVRPGTYHERLVLHDSVAVMAQTPGTVTVDAESEGSVVTAIGVGPMTALSGLWFRNGSSVEGGGLYARAASPQLYDCSFESNTAVLGGGAYLRDGSAPHFERCIFAANTATVGGGLYLDFSIATVSNSYIHSNTAVDGGAVAANHAAEAEFTNDSVYGNMAELGATIAINDASPQFTNCTVANNAGGRETFGARNSGARFERCIVAFNEGVAFACAGSSTLWVGCNLLFRNGDDGICSGDQGTNLWADPLFCDANHYDFGLAANSPAAAPAGCGRVGALPVSCPAQGVVSAVETRSWGHVKLLYGR